MKNSTVNLIYLDVRFTLEGQEGLGWRENIDPIFLKNTSCKVGTVICYTRLLSKYHLRNTSSFKKKKKSFLIWKRWQHKAVESGLSPDMPGSNP